MKRQRIYLILIWIISLTALSASIITADDNDQTGLARVKTRQSIEIYVMCDPVREYEVVGQVTSTDFAGIVGALVGEEECNDITEQVDILLNNAKRKLQKEKVGEFDAIMTDDGSVGILIHFIGD